jgi:nucleotide-binding universal stress UspA family protein
MPTRVIVSYDGTDNDADAIALGRVLRRAGAELSLAYVRHAPEPRTDRELVEGRKAARLLDAGAALLGPPEAARHVVLSASTPDGLAVLAADLDADLIVFGSEYRTPVGRVEPGTSTQRLLEGGRTAVAIAPAGMRGWSDARIGAIGAIGHDGGGDPARETAIELAAALGGAVADDPAAAELLVIASRPDAPSGQVHLAALDRQRINDATVPVLVLPSGWVLGF